MGVMLLCLGEGEVSKIIDGFHGCICGGHYYWKATTHKILKVGFYWPRLFGDVHDKVKACKECQIFVEKQKLTPMHFIHIFCGRTI